MLSKSLFKKVVLKKSALGLSFLLAVLSKIHDGRKKFRFSSLWGGGGDGGTTGENDQNLTVRLLKLPGKWNICFYPYSQ